MPTSDSTLIGALSVDILTFPGRNLGEEARYDQFQRKPFLGLSLQRPVNDWSHQGGDSLVKRHFELIAKEEFEEAPSALVDWV